MFKPASGGCRAEEEQRERRRRGRDGVEENRRLRYKIRGERGREETDGQE